MSTPQPTPLFQNVQSPELRRWFTQTLAAYPELRQRRVYLRKLPMRYSTMRAQPVLNRSFWRRATRHYRVDFSSHLEVTEHVRVRELPEEVVVGWFAHELGHIVDYLHRPWRGMIAFGLGYALWSRYMREAERRADSIAVDHGFGAQIIATKQYLMEHATLPEHYKSRLRKYYLSADEIEALVTAYEERGEMPDIVPIEDEPTQTAYPMINANDRDQQYRSWLTKAPLGLVLTGLGASLISHAGQAKAQQASTLRWVALGTLALTVFNSGLSVLVDAGKHRAHYERLRDTVNPATAPASPAAG